MDNVHQRSLRALLEFAFTHYQDKPFLHFIDGPGYTYGEFHAKAREIAELLARYGIGRGSLVGLLSQNMPNWGVAYFATAAFGGISVPMLPDFPKARSSTSSNIPRPKPSSSPANSSTRSCRRPSTAST